MRRLSLLATFGVIALGGCTSLKDHAKPDMYRTVRADVVALDQPITYNRFGSFNPYGMIYALANDVERTDSHEIGSSECPAIYRLKLKDDVRPRPLVLRGNQGDRLQVRFTNNLLPSDPYFWGATGQPNASKCRWHDIEPADRPSPSAYEEPAYDEARYNPYPDNDYHIDHGNLRPEERRKAVEEDLAEHAGEGAEPPTEEEIDAGIEEQDSTNWPATRTASFVVSGMTALRGAPCDAYDNDPNDPDIWADATDPRVTGIQPIQPGECFVYEYVLGEPGTHLFFSLGAPSGGQGDGGSLVHGLFGSVNVQPRESEYYRSQVTAGIMQDARDQASAPALIDFEATDDYGTPLLNMLKPVADKTGVYDLIHGDLNAVIVDCNDPYRQQERCQDAFGNPVEAAFREFTVIFHDELKTFYPDPIKELGEEYQLEGIGDGFAINYGASGMGGILLANRKGFGPAKDCLECLYEEFFLQSWANGDPALLTTYEDDPANVHHSYLGDRVEFRNLHAGPKETHVFHLHAHQWLAEQDEPGSGESFGTYLDSQTIAPQQGFAYNIYYGGSGNRNHTPGDSIFHCHLYPHFAQGMWALWRVHDVFEDGRRRLPDGEDGPGTDPDSGDTDGGTPIPALVPLPKQAMPPLPTYGDGGMPGYPFYIPARPGHRAPQPPLDFVQNGPDDWEDGGLPRHVFTGKGKRSFGELDEQDQNALSPEQLVQYALRTGDFSAKLLSAEIDLLDNEGEPIEDAAMDFHAGDFDSVTLVDGTLADKLDDDPGYPSITPEGAPDRFLVNNAERQPGAPFADPCRTDFPGDSQGTYDDLYGPERFIRYDVSAIQLDLIVNKAGWHDPQARINVLTSDAEKLEGKTTGGAEPFFFRANSRDCVEFRHENRTPKDLELDDFQVKTPTDTIGQHIHLVKFDVTSSDGSANGFNYEDGTLAPDEVKVRIEAAKAFTDSKGTGDGDQLTLPGAYEETFQTTVQRWYADPLLSGDNDEDRTIRTVFTHDHFAPSSIQHHGFYSALLVEPRDSRWYTGKGELMCPEFVDDVVCEDRPGIGSEAIIALDEETELHKSHREFAMAIADFGLLYAPHQRSEEEEDRQGLDNLVASLEEDPIDGVSSSESDRLIGFPIELRDEIREKHGVPVDPPLLPESISKNHHNPYLVNYRNDPLPLRIGDEDPDSDKSCEDRIENKLVNAVQRDLVSLKRGRGYVGDGVVIDPNDQSVDRQADDRDMSEVFSSAEHGDPCPPTIEGYVGEIVQLRMIQGAQEVQHMFEAQGFNWRREIANPDSPRVAAQEIGISEHFEMELPALNTAPIATSHTDYLYRFSTVDDLWNGAWGLLRSYESSASTEAGCSDDCDPLGERLVSVSAARNTPANESVSLPDDFQVNLTATPAVCPADAPVRLHVVDAVTVKDVLGKKLFYTPDHSIADWDALAFVPIFSTNFEEEQSLGLVPDGTARSIGISNAGEGTTLGLDSETDEVDRNGGFAYSRHLSDMIKLGRSERYTEIEGAETLEPMVLRARAGECVVVRLRNLLLHTLEDGEIVSARNDDGSERTMVDDNDCVSGKDTEGEDEDFCAGMGREHLHGEEGYDPRHLPRIVKLNAIQLQVSKRVGITPQQVHVNAGKNGGILVGWNDEEGPEEQTAGPLEAITYVWYAGEMRTVKVAENDKGHPTLEPRWTPKALGPINLSSLADPIEHGQQGLIGALIVEEADAVAYDRESGDQLDDLPDGTAAHIDPDGPYGPAKPFHEFVLMYQDGLNLRWHNPDADENYDIEAVPDCLVCDDSYDRGEKGVNYRTEPFWARLNQHPTTDLNSRQFPTDFFLDSHKTIATPGFDVTEGDAVTFHVLQPYGRARQRAFMVLGHDYLDLLPHFGSRHSALISVGKAIEAEVSTTEDPRSHEAAKGAWLWRDGPAQHFSSGVWGSFDVEAK